MPTNDTYVIDLASLNIDLHHLPQTSMTVEQFKRGIEQNGEDREKLLGASHLLLSASQAESPEIGFLQIGLNRLRKQHGLPAISLHKVGWGGKSTMYVGPHTWSRSPIR